MAQVLAIFIIIIIIILCWSPGNLWQQLPRGRRKREVRGQRRLQVSCSMFFSNFKTQGRILPVKINWFQTSPHQNHKIWCSQHAQSPELVAVIGLLVICSVSRSCPPSSQPQWRCCLWRYWPSCPKHRLPYPSHQTWELGNITVSISEVRKLKSPKDKKLTQDSTESEGPSEDHTRHVCLLKNTQDRLLFQPLLHLPPSHSYPARMTGPGPSKQVQGEGEGVGCTGSLGLVDANYYI